MHHAPSDSFIGTIQQLLNLFKSGNRYSGVPTHSILHAGFYVPFMFFFFFFLCSVGACVLFMFLSFTSLMELKLETLAPDLRRGWKSECRKPPL